MHRSIIREHRVMLHYCNAFYVHLFGSANEKKFIKMGWGRNCKIICKTTYTPYYPHSQFLKFCNATFGAWLCMVLKLGRFEQQIRNTWKVLKFGAAEGWR